MLFKCRSGQLGAKMEAATFWKPSWTTPPYHCLFLSLPRTPIVYTTPKVLLGYVNFLLFLV